jgi:hypothetical protein
MFNLLDPLPPPTIFNCIAIGYPLLTKKRSLEEFFLFKESVSLILAKSEFKLFPLIRFQNRYCYRVPSTCFYSKNFPCIHLQSMFHSRNRQPRNISFRESFRETPCFFLRFPRRNNRADANGPTLRKPNTASLL